MKRTLGFVRALDGRLFDNKRDWDTQTYKITPLDKPDAPAVEVVANDWNDFVVESETSILADAGDQVLRGTTWTSLSRKDQIAANYQGATFSNQHWWIAFDDGVFRENGEVLEPVATAIKHPLAIARSGTSVYVLEQIGGIDEDDKTKPKAVVWEIAEDGKVTQRASEPLRAGMHCRGYSATSKDGHVAFAALPRGEQGPLFAIDATSAKVIDGAVMALSSIDGGDSWWRSTQACEVAADKPCTLKPI